MKKFDNIEKRQFPRIRLEKSINYKPLDSNRMGNCITKDISAGGLQLLSFELVAKDKRVLIELQLEDEVLRTTGIVVWVKKFPYSGRYKIGIQFGLNESDVNGESIDSSSHTKKVISEYINNRLS